MEVSRLPVPPQIAHWQSRSTLGPVAVVTTAMVQEAQVRESTALLQGGYMPAAVPVGTPVRQTRVTPRRGVLAGAALATLPPQPAQLPPSSPSQQVALEPLRSSALAESPVVEARSVPSCFRCPLTRTVMRHPVATHDGQVYDRSAIEEWFRQGNRTSPITGLELEALTLYFQPALQAAIAAFMAHPSAPREVAECFSISTPVPSVGDVGQSRRGEMAELPSGEFSSGCSPGGVAYRSGTSSGRPPSRRRPNPSGLGNPPGMLEANANSDEAAEVRRLLDGLQSELRRAEEEASVSVAATTILTEPMEMARQVLSSAATGGTGAPTGVPSDDRSQLTAQMLSNGSQLLYGDSLEHPIKGSLQNRSSPSRSRSYVTPASRDRSLSPGQDRDGRNRSRSQPQSRSNSPGAAPARAKRPAPPEHARTSLNRSLRRSPSQEAAEQQRSSGRGPSPVTRTTPRKPGMNESLRSNNRRPSSPLASPGCSAIVPAGRTQSPSRGVSPNRAQSPGRARSPQDRSQSPKRMYTYEGPLPPGYGPGKVPRCALPTSRSGTRLHSTPSVPSTRAPSPTRSGTVANKTGSARDLGGASSSHASVIRIHERQRNVEGGSRGLRGPGRAAAAPSRSKTGFDPPSRSNNAGTICAAPTSNAQEQIAAESSSTSMSRANMQAQQAAQERYSSQRRLENELHRTTVNTEQVAQPEASREPLELLMGRVAMLQPETAPQIFEHLSSLGPDVLSDCLLSNTSLVSHVDRAVGTLFNEDAPAPPCDAHGECDDAAALPRQEASSDRGPTAGDGSVNCIDEAGRTALMHAAGEGDAQALRQQISEGAAVDAIDECQCTALMYAATYGHLEAVRCLAEHGAAVEATSKDGWTPLITAAYNGHLEVVQHLLSSSACIEAADERGWTSLMHVAFNGDNETLRCLLQHDAQVDTLDADGRTALVYAAFNGHIDNVRCLLEKSGKETQGSPVLERARDTALLFASIHGHVEVVILLLEVAPASPETRHAALKLAADHGHHGVVELLVRRSAVDLQLTS